jgi:hypothetical protein
MLPGTMFMNVELEKEAEPQTKAVTNADGTTSIS